MTERENYIRAARFGGPERIPVFFAVNAACYFEYDQDFLFGEMERHRRLFPGFVRPKGKYVPELSDFCRTGKVSYDAFGCGWETTTDGLLGTVVEHPLADLSALRGYRFPDPRRTTGIANIDWEEEKARLRKIRAKGELVCAGLRHGHTFLQMCDIRGYDNFIFDMMDDEPYLRPFLDRLTEFNLFIVDHYMEIGTDVFQIPEDLGMQRGPMLSAENFAEYILPCYRRLAEHVRKGGALIHMHSDGDICALADGLLDLGIDILNVQDLVNGLEWIRKNLKGKVCIDLDIDRQKVTRFGTPAEVEELVREEVGMLSDKAGGLMFTYGLYPGIPEENISRLMDALEKYTEL